MLKVSNDFKTAMTQPIKELQAYIDADGLSIRSEDDLISFEVGCDSGLCKTAMRKLKVKYLGEHNLLGQRIHAGFGVKLESGQFEYLDYGSFLVSELTVTKDTGITEIVAYDEMVNAMKPYTKLDVTYPIDLYTYTQKLCEACGLELGNAVFGRNLLNISTPKTHSANGITFTANGDGSITINGTATGNADFYIYGGWENTNTQMILDGIYKFTIKANVESSDLHGYLIYDKNVIGGVYKTNAPATLTIANKDVSALMFRVNAGATVEDVTIYPILEKSPNTNYKVDYVPYNTMNDWQITQELWENISGITYRDIFVQIAQATASTCIVGNDDKIYFKPLTATGERLTYDNMKRLKLSDKYGEINSVVLSRTPQEDNVYLRDDASIQANGLTEFKIENNEIIDKAREDAILPIYDALRGVSYYPFETTTEGLGWYEIGDSFDIVNDTGDVFNTSLFNFTVLIDGSIKETLKTTAETKTQTQYQYATTIAKRVKNTEVIVNKQEQYIQQLVSDVHDVDGVVNKKYTEIIQNIDGIVNSVQNSGGNNLIKNSVMFAYDTNKVPSSWELEGDGEIAIQSDTEAVANGGLSGHSFTLLNKIVRQRVQVTPNADGNSVYYTFSTKIKKGLAGNCYIKLYNDSEEYTISLPAGESAFYKDYEIKGIAPKETYFIIEFYGSADSNATFTDNTLVLGEYKSQWTQANGEVMNTQVNINIDGILVKSSVYAGDYTVMSPLEFAGYSNINGVITKVFSLNKDVTATKKLEAKDEFKMPPIKIVPITEGDIQGWAFVPST